jgi:hypothetical protein
MTIEPRVEVASSAKSSGFLYVRSENVAVVSVTGERRDPSTSHRAVLQACFARFEVLLRAWLVALPNDRVLLISATPMSDQQNVVTRRRGVWGTDGLRWLPTSAAKSPSVEVSGGEGGTRFAGLAEIPMEDLFEAADFVRTDGESFLLVSSRRELTEERVRSTVASVFPEGESTLDWAKVVALVEEEADMCIRTCGGFDDREAALDAFLRDDLLRKLARTCGMPMLD